MIRQYLIKGRNTMEFKGFTEEEKKLLTPVLDYEVDTKEHFAVDNNLWEDMSLTFEEKTMMLFLTGNYSYQYGLSILSIEDLVKLFNQDESQVRGYLDELERKGYIKQDKVLDRDIFYVNKYVVPKEVYENATEEDLKPKTKKIIIKD